jgi:hypothetical protein
MPSTSPPCPSTVSSAIAPTATKRYAKRCLPAAGILLAVLLLNGCSSGPAVNGILPSQSGNFTLTFTPSDAQIVVVEEEADPRRAIPYRAASASSVGELRYRLTPGIYRVSVSKAGYLPEEWVIEVPELEGSTDGVGGEVSLEVALKPNPNTNLPGDSDEDAVPEPRGFTLRGDPDFEVSQLDEQQRLWYDRLWKAIGDPDQYPDSMRLATSADSYAFARLLSQYDQSLLLGLRATGDLRFLDEIDRVAQEMRASLQYGWCGDVASKIEMSRYGTVYEDDGYLNFNRMVESEVHYCRDVSDLEEPLLHGHIAMIMYAYHVNRGLPSPAGIDYGERADFWLDYLRNHFEAKWRDRTGVEWPGMDFMGAKFCHSYNQLVLYYHYMGERLASDGNSDAQAYIDHAEALTDALFDTVHLPGVQAGGFTDVATPLGPAVVYPFGAPGEAGNHKFEACPTIYTRMVVSAMLELQLDEFYRWGDDSMISKIATGIAYYVMDTDPVYGVKEPFAPGVTGSGEVAGITETVYRSRLDIGQYALSTIAALGAWDNSGKVLKISQQVYRDVESDPNNPRRVFIPASMLLVHSLE